PNGAAGSLPATMTAGSSYTYNFNTGISGSWDVNKIRVAILLIDNADGTVLNSTSTVWPTSVDNISIEGGLYVYPNPAKDQANVKFTVNKASNFTLKVTDVLGRVV